MKPKETEYTQNPTKRNIDRLHDTSMIIKKIIESIGKTRDEFVFIRIPKENMKDDETRKKIKNLHPIIYTSSKNCEKLLNKYKKNHRIRLNGKYILYNKLFIENGKKPPFSNIPNNVLDTEKDEKYNSAEENIEFDEDEDDDDE